MCLHLVEYLVYCMLFVFSGKVRISKVRIRAMITSMSDWLMVTHVYLCNFLLSVYRAIVDVIPLCGRRT